MVYFQPTLMLESDGKKLDVEFQMGGKNFLFQFDWVNTDQVKTLKLIEFLGLVIGRVVCLDPTLTSTKFISFVSTQTLRE